MKGKLKGFLMALVLVLGTLGLTGCSTETHLEDSLQTMTIDEAASYRTWASQLVQMITGFSDEEIEQYLSANDAFSTAALTSWTGVRDDLGTFQEITEQGVTEDGDVVTITSIATFEKAEATIELIASKSTGAPSSMTFNVNYTLAETMKQAGLNTVMGIGIVFLMLLFLSFLIAQFKHISKLEEKFTKKEEKVAPAPAPVAVPAEEEELVDDGELVAVIAAAIAASENTSTDSFVVRSIKKSNAARWKRA